MVVYFSGSRYFHKEFADVYKRIADLLSLAGLKVCDNTVEKAPKGVGRMDESDKIKFYRQIVNLLDKADFSVFEASYPSTIHIGHEITLALERGKPVIVLYLDDRGKEPMLFRGMSHDKVIWVAYNRENLESKLTEAIEKAKGLSDVRFNFFISPKILGYLDWIARKKMIPRAVFLRNLIEKEMRRDRGYRQK